MVMEFIHEGEPLNTYLERANPSVAQRLELFESVCEAVSYLHSRLIIHGDIKPANVLVTPAGISKLLDFGASSLLAADSVARGELTRVMLTPQYASPEQKRGEGPSVPGDIYSLGAVLLEEVLPPPAKRSDVRYILERAMAERPAASDTCPYPTSWETCAACGKAFRCAPVLPRPRTLRGASCAETGPPPCSPRCS